MRTLTLPLALALALVIGACSNDDGPVGADGNVSIKGRVTNAETGAALAGARIVTVPASQAVTTDSTGGYSLATLSAGTYRVVASKAGYHADSVEVAVGGSSPVTADLQLVLNGVEGNRPPEEPNSPRPVNGDVNVDLEVELRWRSSDPEGGPLTFDVWIAKEGEAEARVAVGLAQPLYSFESMRPNTRYNWRVVARDIEGATTSSPVWSFTTFDATLHNALYFGGPQYDGSATAVIVPSSDRLHLNRGSFTIEAWIRPDNLSEGRWHWVASKARSNADNDYLLGVVDGRILLQTRDETNLLRGGTAITPGRWYHVAGVQDAADRKLRVYLDGVLDGEMPLQGIAAPTSADLMFGAREFSASRLPSEPFLGIIHEVRIWSVARSAAQISEDRGRYLSGERPGLVGVWRLNEGYGRKIGDYSAGQQVGEIINAATWMTAELPIP